MNTKLDRLDKTLVLLHGASGAVSEADLVDWIEKQQASKYRRDVLRPAHDKRLIEYDEATRMAHISPAGIAYVEENLLSGVAL